MAEYDAIVMTLLENSARPVSEVSQDRPQVVLCHQCEYITRLGIGQDRQGSPQAHEPVMALRPSEQNEASREYRLSP